MSERFQSIFTLLLAAALVGLPAAAHGAAHIADHVVIAEVVYDQWPDDVDNFVELYNPTVSAVDLTGWSVVGLDGTTGTEYVTVPLSGTIPSEGFFLIGPDASVYGVVPDVVYPGLDLDEGGIDGDGVKLKNDLGELVDYIAYGGEGNPTVSLEGTPFRDVTFNRAIERKSSTTHIVAFGNGEDTDVNADDWREWKKPKPQNSASPAEPPMPYQTEILTILCFNAGQADATLIRSPGGGSFLFDGGNNATGTGTIVPYMQSVGMDTLTYMGASHYHADHIGGLDEVANSGIVIAEGAYDRGWSYPSVTYEDYAAAVSGMRHTFFDGQVFDLGYGCEIECLGLNGNGQLGQPFTQPPWSDNDLSVALYLTFYGFTFFIAGDLTGYDDEDQEDIETSIAAEIPYPVDVYQVDHHGSWKSTNVALTTALMPRTSIFPVGYSVSGHPHAESMARLVSAGSYLYFTDWVNGAPIPEGHGTDVEDHVQVATDGINFFSVDTDIYAFTGTEAAEPQIVLPSGGFRVVQWPNPVHDWTDIQFSIEHSAVPARVSIYDVAGRRIETLADDGLGSGIRTLRWFTGDHPAGVYFYRVEAGNQRMSGKMIVVR